MISNSAEMELLFVTLRQQEAPVPVVVTLSKTNTEKKTLCGTKCWVFNVQTCDTVR